MTMPHLMNCEHSEDGWCLRCVRKLYDQKTRANISIEICDSGGGVYNGSILFKERKAGHVQFNVGDKPKRVAGLIKNLRKLGIEVNFPGFAPERKKDGR